MFFGKKDEKLELMKSLLGSRAVYAETIQNLQLTEDEKMIFQRAYSQLKKDKPDIAIIHQAHDLLMLKSMNIKDTAVESPIHPTISNPTDMLNAQPSTGVNTNYKRNGDTYSTSAINTGSYINKFNLSIGLIIVIFIIPWFINFAKTQYEERQAEIVAQENNEREIQFITDTVSRYGDDFSREDAILLHDYMLEASATGNLSMNDLLTLLDKRLIVGTNVHDYIESCKEQHELYSSLRAISGISDINSLLYSVRVLRGRTIMSNASVINSMASATTAARSSGMKTEDYIIELEKRIQFNSAKSIME